MTDPPRHRRHEGGGMKYIDWKRVGDNLRCPKCGDKAHISAGTDGTEGQHTHHFKISRAWAEELSKPTPEEARAERQKAVATLRDFGVDPETADALKKLLPPTPEETEGHE